MSRLHLHHRRDAFVGLFCAVTASVAVLGGVVALYGDAGGTPWAAADTRLAQAAVQCREQRGADARHRCLRQVAQRHGEAASTVAHAEPPAP